MAIGIGCQPVSAVALPDSSSAERKAWLRKGLSVPAQASHSAASNAATPPPIRATTARSLTGRLLVDDLVGMLRARGARSASVRTVQV